ncbi:MAG: PAS domain S-box protein [Myxococcales bacterium]|nr:PAS domain S-box protein [Myxococcales bacterium]
MRGDAARLPDSGRRRFDDDAEQWRATVTQRSLLLALVTALPLTIGFEVHLYARHTIWPTGLVYPLGPAAIAALFASSVHWRKKAFALCAMLFFFSVVGFFNEGILSDARMLMFSTVVLSAVLLGRDVSLALGSATALSIGVGAGLHLTQLHNMLRPPPADNALTWVIVGFSYLLCFTICLGPLDYLLSRFEINTRDLRKLLGATRAAQQRTDASLAQYRAVFNAGVDGLLVWSFDGQLVDVNVAACTMYGFSRDEFLRKTPGDLLHPDDLAGFLAALQVADLGRVEHVETRHRGADGQWFDVEVARSTFPLGQSPHMLTVVRDITDRRAIVRQMQQLNADLERRVALRTEELTRANGDLEAFAYSVSHDLQAPLRQLRGLTGALSDELATLPESESSQLLGRIQDTTLRMETLVREVLHFSKLGTSPMAQADVPFDRLVAEARETLTELSKGREVRWEVGPLPVLRGDRAMLRQVVVNLLSNALKFTRDRAEARLSVTAHDEPDGRVSIVVEDNGVGFDAARAHELFQVFRRLHPASQFEGTGVGLAHARRIVERHGGTLRGESTGRGARFILTLPPKRSSVEPPPPREDERPALQG